jgi:hypothetical protein
VLGRRIAQVVFRLDGRRLEALSAPNRGNTFYVRINPRLLPLGVHRVTAAVRFNRSTRTRSRTLQLSFQRCARRLQAPRFTG